MSPPPAYQSPMMVVDRNKTTTTAATTMQQQQPMEAAATATTSASASSLRSPLTAANSKANKAAGAAKNSTIKTNQKTTGQKNENDSNAAGGSAAAGAVWEYPLGVPLPHKALLRSLYQTAMHNTNSNHDDTGNNNCDQQQISDLGLLSMEDVLLPAIAYQEERALKQIQAVVLRDYPQDNAAIVDQVVQARKAVYDATRAAVQACQENRLQHRLPQQAAREAVWKQERQVQLQEMQRQQALQQRKVEEIRLEARERRRQEKKDKHPVNQELWREVAYLMTEMHHLEKEERLWKDAAVSLQQQEKQQTAADAAGAAAATMQNSTAKQQRQESNDDGDDVDAMDVDGQDDNHISQKMATPELAQMMETIDGITISAVRVEQSLQMVADMMEQSNQLRSEIYRRHEAERFRGYPGEREPKDLIRLLSQE